MSSPVMDILNTVSDSDIVLIPTLLQVDDYIISYELIGHQSLISVDAVVENRAHFSLQSKVAALD